MDLKHVLYSDGFTFHITGMRNFRIVSLASLDDGFTFHITGIVGTLLIGWCDERDSYMHTSDETRHRLRPLLSPQ